MDLRIFTEPQQGAGYEQQRRMAVTAEDAGYDGFFRSDHYLVMGPSDGLPGPTDAWTTLAGLARDTRRVRLGTLVNSATFRLPGPLAVQVAQVDQMSGGRVELGLGAGWYEAEHTAYGIPFPPVGERFDRLEEQLAVLTGLWGTPVGERFSFAGRHYRLQDCPALPRPVQSPVPLIMGGVGPRRTPELAARHASEFNAMFLTPQRAQEVFARVRQACTAIGRDPQELTWSAAMTTVVGKDDAEVRRRAEAVGRSVESLKADHLAGTPAEVLERIAAYRQAGVTRLYLQILDLDDLDHLEFIASAVAPQLG